MRIKYHFLLYSNLSYQSDVTFSYTHQKEVTWQEAKRVFLEAHISVNSFLRTMRVGMLQWQSYQANKINASKNPLQLPP